MYDFDEVNETLDQTTRLMRRSRVCVCVYVCVRLCEGVSQRSELLTSPSEYPPDTSGSVNISDPISNFLAGGA